MLLVKCSCLRVTSDRIKVFIWCQYSVWGQSEYIHAFMLQKKWKDFFYSRGHRNTNTWGGKKNAGLRTLTTSVCHWPQKRMWSSWWPHPSPRDRSWSCWWSTCMRTLPLWSDREKSHSVSFKGPWAEACSCCVNQSSTACVVTVPVCNTSSRPQARWTFPQGEGDSELLTLPAWQRVLRATVWRDGGNLSPTLLSVWSRRPSASVRTTRKQFAPGKQHSALSLVIGSEHRATILQQINKEQPKKTQLIVMQTAKWLINPIKIQHHLFNYAVCDSNSQYCWSEMQCLILKEKSKINKLSQFRNR